MPLRSSPRVIAVVAVASAAVVPVLSAAPATAAPSDTSPRHAVVVLLRDPLTATPARGAGLAARQRSGTAQQDAVLARLAGPAATGIRHLTVANAVEATVTTIQAAALEQDPAVQAVTAADVTLPLDPTAPASPDAPTGATQDPSPAAVQEPAAVPASACTGTETAPQLEPEALSVIGAASDDPTVTTAASLGATGAGVKVAYVADRINPANKDFQRADGTSAVTEQVDFVPVSESSSSADEAFGDAGAIVAQGIRPHDLADFVDPTAVSLPNGHCWIRVRGVAPDASVVALRAIGTGTTLISLMRAIDYAVTTAHVDVLNESLGTPAIPEGSAREVLTAANTAAVAAGVTVVVSSGDSGDHQVLNTPAAAPDVIAVGATTTLRAAVQTGTRGTAAGPVTGWRPDQVSPISTSAPTSAGRGVDLVAPGDSNWAPCSTDAATYSGCGSDRDRKVGAGLENFAGTSQSAPYTAGTAALVIQAYRDTHSGSSPSPAVVKQILVSSAADLGAPADLQGAGRLDATAAVTLARRWPGAVDVPSTTPALAAVTTEPAQLAFAGTPGTAPEARRVRVTNHAATPVTLTPTVRTLVPVSTTSTAVTVDTGPGAPSFIGADALQYEGHRIPSYYTPVPVPVAPGTGFVRITVSAASGIYSPWVTVYDPHGAVVATSLTQGDPAAAPGGATLHAEVTLTAPEPGTWTAQVRQVGLSVSGPITLTTEADQWQTVAAAVTPVSTVVAGGASTDLTVSPTIPADAAATTWALDLDGTASGHVVPVVLQPTLRPTADTPAAFQATLRGGNGRDPEPSQTLTYDVTVEAGHRSLTADLDAAGCGCDVLGVLVDPSGHVRSTGTNADMSDNRLDGVHQTVLTPDSGTWRYFLVVGTVVTRQAATSPLRGVLSLDVGDVVAPTLPTGVTLTAGTTTTVPVTVDNPAAVPMAVFVTGVTDANATSRLAPLTPNGEDLSLPFTPSKAIPSAPLYLVPPDATSLTSTLTADVPTLASLQSPLGGQLTVGGSTTASSPSTVVVTDPDSGVWTTATTAVGTFTTAAPTGTGHLHVEVTAPVTDAAVGSPTGDVPRDAGDTGGTPVVVPPRGSLTVPVTITPPTSAVGSRVTGQIRVVTALVGAATGLVSVTAGLDVIGRLPYAYTVAAVGPTPAPTTPTDPPTGHQDGPAQVASAGGAGRLATTGADLGLPLALGLAAVAAGTALLTITRRPRGQAR